MFFTIAATSLVLIVNVALAAKETGVKNELSSQTETIILENIGSSGEDKYYATMGGKWVYSYLDSKGDVQIRDVDAECCYKHRGDMNGKAFLSITTTNYEVEYKYLCFVAYRYESAQTYVFYIP